MFLKKNISTYVIKSSSENAYAADERGKLIRDENRRLELYDREYTVNIIGELLDKKQITKGIKIDNPNKKYIVYTFNYERKHGDKAEKYIYRVKMDRRYLEENQILLERLDSYILKSINIHKQNVRHNVLTGVAVGALVIGFGFALIKGEENENRIQEEKNRAYIEQINEERRENDMPPLGAKYEDGRPFEGSYTDWAKYISGYTDAEGNVIVEDGEIPEVRHIGN